jgi:hypothetical protein
MYEPPELVDLGEVTEVTLGKRIGDHADGAGGFTFAPVTPEDLPEDE